MGVRVTVTTENYHDYHALYCQATTRDIPYSMVFHYRWALWASKGYSKDDLLVVIAFIKRRIKEKRRQPESLRLHNLLDPERFIDDLLDARQEVRKPAPSARQEALRSIGRTEPQPERTVTPAQVLAANEGLRKLLELRDSL